ASGRQDSRQADDSGDAFRDRASGKGARHDGERDLRAAGREAHPHTRQAADGEDPARVLSQRADEGDPKGARRRGSKGRARGNRGEDKAPAPLQGGAREGAARAQEASADVADVGRGYRRAQLSRLAPLYSLEQEEQGEEGSQARAGDPRQRSLWSGKGEGAH